MYCIAKGFCSCLGQHFASLVERIVQGRHCLSSHVSFRTQSLSCVGQSALLYAPIYELADRPLSDRIYYLLSKALQPIKAKVSQMGLTTLHIHTIIPGEDSIRRHCINPATLLAWYSLLFDVSLTVSFSEEHLPQHVLQQLEKDEAYFVLGGVDSFIEPILFRELQIKYGLLTAQSDQGVAPGEGAAFGLFTANKGPHSFEILYREGQKALYPLFTDFVEEYAINAEDISMIVSSAINIPSQMAALHQLQQEVWLKNLNLQHNPQPEFFYKLFPAQYHLHGYFGWLGCAQLPANILLLDEMVQAKQATALSINMLEKSNAASIVLKRNTQ